MITYVLRSYNTTQPKYKLKFYYSKNGFYLFDDLTLVESTLVKQDQMKNWTGKIFWKLGFMRKKTAIKKNFF